MYSSRSSSPGGNDSGRSWPFHLSISVGTTQDRLGHLFDAARRFSEAHAGETPLGLISYRHARTLVGQAWSIPTEGLSAFEVALLPAAQTLTVAKLKQKAQVLRERLHPETSATRRARSILDRTSWVQAEPDGMATLHLTPGVGQGVGATVQVTVSVLTLLGHSEEPGYLEGYGPISSETARDLAFRRVQKICARRRPRSHPRLAPSRPNRRRQPHSPL